MNLVYENVWKYKFSQRHILIVSPLLFCNYTFSNLDNKFTIEKVKEMKERYQNKKIKDIER